MLRIQLLKTYGTVFVYTLSYLYSNEMCSRVTLIYFVYLFYCTVLLSFLYFYDCGCRERERGKDKDWKRQFGEEEEEETLQQSTSSWTRTIAYALFNNACKKCLDKRIDEWINLLSVLVRTIPVAYVLGSDLIMDLFWAYGEESKPLFVNDFSFSRA